MRKGDPQISVRDSFSVVSLFVESFKEQASPFLYNLFGSVAVPPQG